MVSDCIVTIHTVFYWYSDYVRLFLEKDFTHEFIIDILFFSHIFLSSATVGFLNTFLQLTFGGDNLIY